MDTVGYILPIGDIYCLVCVYFDNSVRPFIFGREFFAITRFYYTDV